MIQQMIDHTSQPNIDRQLEHNNELHAHEAFVLTQEFLPQLDTSWINIKLINQ